MLPSSCAISFAYNAKCYHFCIHNNKNMHQNISERTVLLNKISSVRKEVCVNTGRLTGGLLCIQKGKEKESRQSPSRKIQQMDLASAITNITKRQLPDHHVCVCVMTLFKLWWFISHIKTCSALGEGLTWVNSVRTPGTPQKKLNDPIHWLARRADIEI